jgi:hypothetical protein
VPTYARTARCIRDYADLDAEERKRFKDALKDFIEDFENGRQFRPGLRVKGVQGTDGVFEMTCEYHNGRATFEFGDTSKGEPNVIWRRIGGHEIFDNA